MLLTASTSNPAKLVVSLSGFLSLALIAITTPGRAVPAEQPHTEFIITNDVPPRVSVSSTSCLFNNSVKPFSVNSSFIGITISSGYIFFYLECKFTLQFKHNHQAEFDGKTVSKKSITWTSWLVI